MVCVEGNMRNLVRYQFFLVSSKLRQVENFSHGEEHAILHYSCLPSSIMISIQPRNVLKNPHLFNKLSKLFRDVKFWSVQTQNSVETLFLSERANTQLFRTSKIFEIDALFVKLEGFLYWSQVLETFHAYLKHTCRNTNTGPMELIIGENTARVLLNRFPMPPLIHIGISGILGEIFNQDRYWRTRICSIN